MAASRATTMGSDDRSKLDSAMYFTGPNMDKSRVLDIKHKLSGSGSTKQLYKKVALREKWVARLDENTLRPEHGAAFVQEVREWTGSFQMSKDELGEALSKRAWRRNMRKGLNY